MVSNCVWRQHQSADEAKLAGLGIGRNTATVFQPTPNTCILQLHLSFPHRHSHKSIQSCHLPACVTAGCINACVQSVGHPDAEVFMCPLFIPVTLAVLGTLTDWLIALFARTASVILCLQSLNAPTSPCYSSSLTREWGRLLHITGHFFFHIGTGTPNPVYKGQRHHPKEEEAGNLMNHRQRATPHTLHSTSGDI